MLKAHVRKYNNVENGDLCSFNRYRKKSLLDKKKDKDKVRSKLKERFWRKKGKLTVLGKGSTYIKDVGDGTFNIGGGGGGFGEVYKKNNKN